MLRLIFTYYRYKYNNTANNNINKMLNKFENRSFAIEVWKGHEHGGKGFKYFLDKLSNNGMIIG